MRTVICGTDMRARVPEMARCDLVVVFPRIMAPRFQR